MSPRQKAAGQPRLVQQQHRPAPQPRLVRPQPPSPSITEPIDRDAPCYIQLGRFGDIVNLLPILRETWRRTCKKPYVVVARRYASIFDGVSYVRPVMFGDDWGAVLPALDWAKKRWSNPIVTQVRGHGWEADHKCSSWNIEQHRLAGFPEGFMQDEYPRILFDRRVYNRERRLIDRFVPISEKPLMLLNISGGVSSPLRNHAEIQQRIVKAWGPSFNIVDVAKIVAERVFDLIGLCEVADCLITSDTSLLHLAQATGVNTIAFLSDESEWCATNLLQEGAENFFGKTVTSNWDRIDTAIQEAFDRSYRAFFHVHEDHDPKSEREHRAQTTWDYFTLSSWDRCGYSAYRRDASVIGDPRKLPFLKDVLECVFEDIPDDNYLVLTNSDVALTPDIDRRIRNKMRRLVMATGRRIDVPSLDSRSPDHGAHCGRDIVVWRTEWLRRNLWSIPDFILGASLWDYWAAGQARILAGGTWNWKQDREDHISEIEPGAVLHEVHKPVWETGAKTFPSQVHNRRCYKEWLASVGLSDEL